MLRTLACALALCAACALASPATAQETSAAAAGPTPQSPPPQSSPRLIVAISVDQFSADLFAQYREHFDKGLGRLLKGAVFPSGYQSHAATETCPGHSTLLTGVHPARTGIVANDWFDARLGRMVYCVEDESNPASTAEVPVVATDHLLVPTLGEMLKARTPASRNVAVSAKDRAAVMMSGHRADAVYWFLGNGFTTFAGEPVAAAAKAENTALATLLAADLPPLAVPAWCQPLDRATTVAKGLAIGTYRFPNAAGNFRDFAASPRIDTATTDMAVRLVDEFQLGGRGVPDILSVSYSATDKVGHAYGNQGVEMCIQMAELDRTIGTLLDALDSRGIDYLVALSADHGAPDAPERMKLNGVSDAARLDGSLTAEALSEAVSKATGITVAKGRLFYGAGSSGDVWLNAELTGKRRAKAIAALVATLKSNPQISGVYTAEQLRGVKVPTGHPQDWSEIERVAASYNSARSGEVLMMVRRGVVPGTAPKPGKVVSHGSPWDYDRRVPIVFWRKGMAPVEQAAPVETVDIAPTLAAILGLPVPAGTFDGRCLDITAGEGDTCAR